MVISSTRLIVFAVIAVLCVSLLPPVHAQAVGSQVSPFDFQLDESAVDGKRYSYVTSGGNPAAIIKQNETKSLPVIILSATDTPIPIRFHVTVGNNQTGPIQMPLGVHAIVDPSEIVTKPHQNETINIVVSVEKNAPSGKYQLNIVGEWPGPNGFVGSAVIINVGKDYGPNAMPFNFLWTPLKLYQSGVAIKDIQCNQGLQFVIKTEDGSPACVTPQTLQTLVERSWGTSWTMAVTKNTSENSTRSNPVIDIISISGTDSPPNPGGPEIQLTLMNIGTKPVTSLNATLGLNNNYVFNFKDVTESNPLAPGHLASDTETLIGAGSTNGIAYPLTVIGTENNETFSYTQNVPIPYTNENGITNIRK